MSSSPSSRIAASRANGKKPHWPVTPAATKACYDLTAPDHTAQSICLKHENQSDFIKMHNALIAEHAPAGATGQFMVQWMAVTRWRLQRARLIENAMLVKQMDEMMADPAQLFESLDAAARAALCLRTLTATSPSFKFLLRYKRSLSRQLNRTLAHLADLHAANANRQTNPKMNNQNEVPLQGLC